MTTHKDTASIIKRLEAASGPDYAIDLDIARLQGVTVMQHNIETGGNDEATHHRYTASLDSALSLVPEEESSNFEVSLEQSKRQKRTYWDATIGHMHFDAWTGRAPTPAIALCIAALRARANKG